MELSKKQLELIISVLEVQKHHLQQVTEETFSMESMLQMKQKSEHTTAVQKYLMVSYYAYSTTTNNVQTHGAVPTTACADDASTVDHSIGLLDHTYFKRQPSLQVCGIMPLF